MGGAVESRGFYLLVIEMQFPALQPDPGLFGGGNVIDTLKEKVYPLNHARRFFPRRRKNKRPDLSTMYRWTGKGCRGVVLEWVNVGGTRCTSREATARFIGRLSRLDEAPPVRASGARNRANRRAEEELDRIGI